MDNALIDDRRIHVDFSQSVSKLWSQYRRKGQTGQGGGCFKCGSVDHIAKDCTGDSTSKQANSKYTLKDDNRQHGGDGSTRYEMVFEEDGDRGRRHSKGRRDDKPEHDEKRNRHDDAHNHHKDHNEKRRDTRNPYKGRAKEYPEKNDSGDGRKMDTRDESEHRRRHGSGDDDDGHKRRRDDKEYEKSHREDHAGYGYKRKERNYEKRLADDGGGRGERKYENESRNKSGGEYLRGSRCDVGDDDSSYGHKRRGEERYSSDRRSYKR